MNAAALAAVPTGTVRPVAWHSLGWVAWRHHRRPVLTILGVIALVAIYLLASGLQMRSAWSTVQSCTPQASKVCVLAWNSFRETYSNPGILSALFLFAPLLIGAFTGAPLLGGELETGTFRYAWTQGAGRTRWAVATILTGAVAVAILAAALGALITWHDQPLWQADVAPRLQASEFPTTGVAVVGWGLAAYGVGVLAGLLWRRVLAALATGVLTTFGLAYVASTLRLHYLAPLATSSLDHVVGSQPLSQWWEKGGSVATTGQLNSVLQAAGLDQIQGGNGSSVASPGQGTDPTSYLLQHGYTLWTSYQPAGRYWTFQWIEFGWLTALAALLLATTLLLLRHRDA